MPRLVVGTLLLILLEIITVYGIATGDAYLVAGAATTMVLLVKTYDEEFREAVLEAYEPIEPLSQQLLEDERI